MPEFASLITGSSPVSPSGWIRAIAVDYTALTPTTFTPADVGTTQIVDGISFDINLLPANTVTVGSANGLSSTNNSCDIATHLDYDMSNLKSSVCTVYAVDDTGTQCGVWCGSAWNRCWANLRTGAGGLQIQRRDVANPLRNCTLAEGTATALMTVGDLFHNTFFAYFGPVDPANLPPPDDPGWTFVPWGMVEYASGVAGVPLWPFSGPTAARFNYWRNGSMTFKVFGIAIFVGTPEP